MWETQTDRQTDSQPSVKCTDVVVSHEPLRLPTAKMAKVCCMASISNWFKIFFLCKQRKKVLLLHDIIMENRAYKQPKKIIYYSKSKAKHSENVKK